MTRLFTFSDFDGDGSAAALVRDDNGSFYGISNFFGQVGSGTVYRLDPVSDPAPAAPSISLTADHYQVTAGSNVDLSWDVSGASNCVADGYVWSEQVPFNGEHLVAVSQVGSNTFSLICSAVGATAIQSVVVTGLPPAQVSLNASPASVRVGQNTTLTWNSSNASSCLASGDWSGVRALSGSAQVLVGHAGTNTFTLACDGASKSVSVNGIPPPGISLTPNPDTVAVGGTSTLTWNVSNATSCSASGAWSGAKALSGSQSVTAAQSGTYTYTLTCSGAGGSASQSATVTALQPPGVGLFNDPNTPYVAVGANITLNWNSARAQSCTASGAWSGPRALSGSETVVLNSPGDATFALTCSGIGGTSSHSMTLTAFLPPVISLNASPSTLGAGQSATLNWNATDAQLCSASGGWSGSKSMNGSEGVTAATPGTVSYTLTCQGWGGTSAQSTAVTYLANPTVALAANPTAVTVGQSTMLNWNAENASSCVASGVWAGSLPISGSQIVVVQNAGANSYTLTCTGSGGSATQTTSVNGIPLMPTLSFAANPVAVPVGQTSTLRWSSTDAQSCTASGAWSGAQSLSGSAVVTISAAGPATYSLSCTGPGGTTSNAVTISGLPPPTLTVSANATALILGQSSTISWSSTNTDSCNASGAWSGAQPTSGSASVTPSVAGASNYTLACTGSGGSVTQSVTINATPPAILHFAAEPAAVPVGQSSTLTWSSTDTTSCTASGAWNGTQATSGTATMTITTAGPTSYSLSCSGAGGTASSSVTVTGLPPPTLSLAANPAALILGQNTMLSWTTTNADSCTASGAWSGTQAASGSASVTPMSTGANSYMLTCTGSGGSIAQTAVVNATPPATLSFSANPAAVAVGQASTLTWSSTGTTSCTASGGWSGTQATTGSADVTIAAAGAANYALSCSGAGGTAVNTVTVMGVPPPAINLAATPPSGVVGQSAHLTWSSTDAQSCTAFGNWSGARPVSGSADAPIYNVGSNNEYQLRCTGVGGTSTASVLVTGRPAPSVSLIGSYSAHAGDGTTLRWDSVNVQTCTASGGWSGTLSTSGTQAITVAEGATSYGLACTGSDGSVSTSVTITGYPRPTLNLAASASTLYVGDSVTLTWSSDKLNSCVASGAWSGSKANSGSESVAVAAAGSNEFWLTCQDALGPWSAEKTVTATVPTTLNFNSSSSEVPVGQSVSLNWTTGNADSCSASGAWSGAKAVSGSQSVLISNPGNNNFGLSCTGSGGNPIVLVTVKGMPVVSLSASPTSVKVGGTSKLTWSSTYSNSCTASGAWSGSQSTSGTKTVTVSSAGNKVYTLACSGLGGNTTVSTTVTGVPAPTVTITANPASVIVGQNTTLTWSSTDATSCTASGSWSGTKSTSGSASVAITSTGSKTFTLACTGVGGSASKSATATGVNPTVNFATTSEATAPGATSTTNVLVTLSGATSNTVTVPFTTGGTAGTTTYNVAPSTKKLTIAAGATSGYITVNVTSAVCNKTVTLTLGTPTNGTLGTAKTNTLTIKSATGCP
ncbi:MAG TPA: hypothetical protein VHE37_13630 [Nevskiaceae bacterium]|nr:hypothetical protein [Nevskiaceae bacterium]